MAHSQQSFLGGRLPSVFIEEEGDAAAAWGDESLLAAQAFFCLGTAFALFRTLPASVEFYSWFSKSGLEISRHRGFGQTACDAFGLWRAPHLGVFSFTCAGVTLLVSLVGIVALPAAWWSWRAPLVVLALAMYFLYFSQLYCEAHVGAHVTVLIPPCLVVLATTPALDAGVDPEVAHRAAVFAAWLVKANITIAYCGSGLSKLLSSWKAGRWWCSGPTMQACIFEGLFMSKKDTHTSFGLPTPFSHYFQRFIVQYPKTLCAPFSAFALWFEFLAPLILLLPARPTSAVFAIAGIGFHYGIALLQNIDFVSWWGPAYAFFIFDPAASSGSPACTLAEAFAAAYVTAPWRTALVTFYMIASLAACIVLRFFPAIELLPFSAFPMYSDLKDLFDPAKRATLYFSEKPHATGTLKNYCFPFCRPQVVTKEELVKLPFKYMYMRHGGVGEAPEIVANVVITEEFDAALKAYRRLTSEQGVNEAAVASANGSAQRMRDLTKALDTARAAFRAAPRTTAEKKEPDDLSTPLLSEDQQHLLGA